MEDKVKVEYDGLISGEASPFAIDAFVEILKNQADNSKNYRTIRDKDFLEKEYYTISHYKGDDDPIKRIFPLSYKDKSKGFEYVRIEEAEVEFAFEVDTQKLAFIINYKD
tara:strand:+ start:336 stop:665 length:330 start_codon:yes stop_codon:yes gene_type:complete